jgi:hypothetical protein
MNRIGLTPDYHASIKELYVKVARSILGHRLDLDLPSIPRLAEDANAIPRPPSWVPDWSVVPQYTEPASFGSGIKYHSSRDRIPSPAFHEGEILEVQGPIVDRIEDLATFKLRFWNRQGFSEDDQGHVTATRVAWCGQLIVWELEHVAHHRGKYVTGEDFIDIYGAMITAAVPNAEPNGTGAEEKMEA